MNKKPSTLIVDYGHGYLYPNLGPVFEFPSPLCDLWLSVEAEDYLLFYKLFRILVKILWMYLLLLCDVYKTLEGGIKKHLCKCKFIHTKKVRVFF